MSNWNEIDQHIEAFNVADAELRDMAKTGVFLSLQEYRSLVQRHARALEGCRGIPYLGPEATISDVRQFVGQSAAESERVAVARGSLALERLSRLNAGPVEAEKASEENRPDPGNIRRSTTALRAVLLYEGYETLLPGLSNQPVSLVSEPWLPKEPPDSYYTHVLLPKADHIPQVVRLLGVLKEYRIDFDRKNVHLTFVPHEASWILVATLMNATDDMLCFDRKPNLRKVVLALRSQF